MRAQQHHQARNVDKRGTAFDALIPAYQILFEAVVLYERTLALSLASVIADIRIAQRSSVRFSHDACEANLHATGKVSRER
ncbi:hypothetical protein [Paraburkholderia dinghuensis]|uniref:hypothetical protein n=1 Tax=Paraburkholderia dinghuensis TaxID=2305225 RepID=UPI000F51D701|nr:hypothetical protein [Paraburkholderia dinghuensis]